MEYNRPRLRVYVSISTVILSTLLLCYLDYTYTLIPRMSANTGKVFEDNYITKYPNIYHNSESKTRKILVWTAYFDTPEIWTNEINSNLKKCIYSCSATYDRTNLPLSDAIMFHDADINFRDMPGLRIRRQPWILFTMEPTALIKKNYKWLDNVFNWTISYRNYSTLLGKYGHYENKGTPEKTRRVTLTNKNKTMFAAISNCHDAGRRFKLIKQINEFLDVDLFGRCSPKKCIANHGPCQSKEILDQYKFKLAFENSHCRHYVTEKYWETLGSNFDHIPIVNWIPQQANPKVIPHSYINFYDFKNMKEFVKYINDVSTNETLFQQYFEWRKKYEIVGSDTYCKLCEKLHKPFQGQVYNDLNGWFKDDTCTKYSLIGMAGRWVDRKIFNLMNK